MHIKTKDHPVVRDAFMHGYTHNLRENKINGKSCPTLTVQCVHGGEHVPEGGDGAYSVWTRDLYWGFLGWAQAGDDSVIELMRTSILALVYCKNINKADGDNKFWRLDDGRFYVPQAYTDGPEIAENFFPYCSESQVDFLLLAQFYWLMSGDTAFVRSIWDEVIYVTETVELMDTNGNSLPDSIWGSYDYQPIGVDSEEPLMCAKTFAAYGAVAQMASAIGDRASARRLSALAKRVKETMCRPVAEGGLWNPTPDGGGYFVNLHGVTENNEWVDDEFVPYNNLVPIFYGIPSKKQTEAIFGRLDAEFESTYALKWGPMRTARTFGPVEGSIGCSSTPWLAFLDVFLRAKLGREKNRSEIFGLLIEHAYDVPAAPFAEGAGITGVLTGGAGRAWDNGNFFHCLISGIYGIEKSQSGISISDPVKMEGFPLTELKNVRWRDAIYNIKWEGIGTEIREIALDDKILDKHILMEKTGRHEVIVKLG